MRINLLLPVVLLIYSCASQKQVSATTKASDSWRIIAGNARVASYPEEMNVMISRLFKLFEKYEPDMFVQVITGIGATVMVDTEFEARARSLIEAHLDEFDGYIEMHRQ